MIIMIIAHCYNQMSPSVHEWEMTHTKIKRHKIVEGCMNKHDVNLLHVTKVKRDKLVRSA